MPYELSDGEQDLYDAVTQYVREEMNRADRLDRARGNTVGFALTVLQRRLASSPEAILRSLERHRKRLERRRRQLATDGQMGEEQPLRRRLDELLGRSAEDLDDRLDDLPSGELEQLEDDVVDAATAARTIAELDHEIAVLADLEELAYRVRHSDTDRKWSELRTLLGRPESVVCIHGGAGREERRTTRELFTQDTDVRVLVATDAAGEGLNLQRAHLMVNYDLPWNPNKIDQRFGRIHRIGQDQVCHLGNLVAKGTREGDVFLRLLDKIEEQRRTYAGKVFDVLGDVFEDQPLRALLIEAIRYGDRPDVQARLRTVIDETVGDGLADLIAERALHREVLAATDVDQIRRQLEEVQARRLQPHYVEAFFVAAFGRLGGRISRRETGRYEITHVPGDIRDRDRMIGTGAPVIARCERVAFDRSHVRLAGSPRADLLAPGHPLLEAVVDLTIEQHLSALKQGTVLVDRDDPSETPRLLVALTQVITDGHQPPRSVSKRFEFAELNPDGGTKVAGPAPYLDYETPQPDEAAAVASAVDQPWLVAGFADIATGWASSTPSASTCAM